jgi:hypothetical protein
MVKKLKPDLKIKSVKKTLTRFFSQRLLCLKMSKLGLKSGPSLKMLYCIARPPFAFTFG